MTSLAALKRFCVTSRRIITPIASALSGGTIRAISAAVMSEPSARESKLGFTVGWAAEQGPRKLDGAIGLDDEIRQLGTADPGKQLAARHGNLRLLGVGLDPGDDKAVVGDAQLSRTHRPGERFQADAKLGPDPGQHPFRAAGERQ